MLRILGGPKRLCDGITRRDLLQVGSLGLLGLGLREWPLATPAKAADALPSSSLPGFGRAKACILLFMYGSPSQLETFDPKPEAPVEIRGEFGCIPSSVPGLNVCERLPRLCAGDGQGHADPLGDASVPDPRRRLRDDRESRGSTSRWSSTRATPTTGRSSARSSITSTGDGRRRTRPGARPVPRNLVLPWAFSSQRVGEVPRVRAVWRLPRPGVRPGLHRVRRPGARRRRGRRSPARSGKTSSRIAGSRRKAGFS